MGRGNRPHAAGKAAENPAFAAYCSHFQEVDIKGGLFGLSSSARPLRASECVIDGVDYYSPFGGQHLGGRSKALHMQGLGLTGLELRLLSVVRHISTHLIELCSLSFTAE